MKNRYFSGLAIHVFAGHLTYGFQHYFEVENQLEVFTLGNKTAERNCGVYVHRCDSWQKWPVFNADVIFGNPRCTGFSMLNTSRGNDAYQTTDIKQMMAYAQTHVAADRIRPKFIIFESVQNAATVGRLLLVDIALQFRSLGYQATEVFTNGHLFGNPQERPRYWFVLHDKHVPFNPAPPPLLKRHTVTWEAIRDWVNVPLGTAPNHDCDYSWASTHFFNMRNVKQGAGIQSLKTEDLGSWYKNARERGKSFSWHAPYRLHPFGRCSVIYSVPKYIHPYLDRPISVREGMLLMGLPPSFEIIANDTLDAWAQVGKAVVLDSAVWLAREVNAALEGKHDDFRGHRIWNRNGFESEHCPDVLIALHNLEGWAPKSLKGKAKDAIAPELEPWKTEYIEFLTQMKEPASYRLTIAGKPSTLNS